jgi:hypothetical protein
VDDKLRGLVIRDSREAAFSLNAKAAKFANTAVATNANHFLRFPF